MIVLGGWVQVYERHGVSIKIPRTISSRAITHLQITKALAIKLALFCSAKNLARYILSHYPCLLVGKYPRFGQKETSGIRLSNGGDVSDGEDTRIRCFKRLQINRHPSCLVSKAGLLHYPWCGMGRYTNQQIEGNFTSFKDNLAGIVVYPADFLLWMILDTTLFQHAKHSLPHFSTGRRKRSHFRGINSYLYPLAVLPALKGRIY